MTISSLQEHLEVFPATKAGWHHHYTYHEHTRSHRSVFSQMGNGQSKDSSPHDGMEQTYCREQPRIIQKNGQQGSTPADTVVTVNCTRGEILLRLLPTRPPTSIPPQ